jgi:hypothetical protein
MRLDQESRYARWGRVFKVRQALEVVELMSDGVEIPANARDMTQKERDEVVRCLVRLANRVREGK